MPGSPISDARVAEALHVSSVDPAELRCFLLWQIGQGRYVAGDGMVCGKNGKELLRLRDESGEGLRVQAGVDLTPEVLADLSTKIQTDLLDPSRTTIAREFMFADKPCRGYFAYEQEFQMLHPPDGAPLPPFSSAQFPFVLEFSMRDSPNDVVHMVRRSAGLRYCSLVLGALLDANICASNIHSSQSQHVWGLEAGVDKSSRYVQVMYRMPGFRHTADSFERVENARPIPSTSATVFYTRREGGGPQDEFDLPDDLSRCLAILRTMSSDHRDKFLRSAYWVGHAAQVFDLSISATYLAIMSAIEALLPPEDKSRECPTCRRPWRQGAKSPFHEFLETYAGSDQYKVGRENLYRVRSAVSHGGRLLAIDTGLHAGRFTWQQVAEFEGVELARRVARYALHNWLLHHAP